MLAIAKEHYNILVNYRIIQKNRWVGENFCSVVCPEDKRVMSIFSFSYAFPFHFVMLNLFNPLIYMNFLLTKPLLNFVIRSCSDFYLVLVGAEHRVHVVCACGVTKFTCVKSDSELYNGFFLFVNNAFILCCDIIFYSLIWNNVVLL